MKGLVLVRVIAGVALIACVSAQAAEALLHQLPASYPNTDISRATLFGGAGQDHGHFVICGQDGSCTLVGTTGGSFGDSSDYLIVRLGADGKTLWSRTYGGSGNEALMDAIPTQDGGTLLVGNSFSRFWDMVTYENGRAIILKLDKDGKLQWVKLLQNHNDRDYSVLRFTTATQTADGSYVLSGAYISPPVVKDDYWPTDAAVLKLSSDGKPLWLHHYHFGQSSYGGGVLVQADGRIRITANYFDMDNVHSHPLLLTLAAEGTPTQAVEYLYDGNLFPFDIGQQADGKLLMPGEVTVDKQPLANQAMLLWLDQDGAPQGGRTYSIDGGFALRHAKYLPGGIALVGNTGTAINVLRSKDGPEYDAVALLLDGQGAIKSGLRMGTTQRNPRGFGDSEFWDVAPLKTGQYCLLGGTDAFGAGDADMLSALWTPAASPAAFVKISSLDVKAQPLPLPTVSGDVSGVRDLPPGRLDVLEIKTGDGKQ